MVFRAISESEPSPSTVPTASIVSAKSLHNFSLTDLKWSPAYHRFRRQPADSVHRSPLRDDGPRLGEPNPGTCRRRALNDLPPHPPRSAVQAQDQKDKSELGAVALNGRSSKILLRFRTKDKSSYVPAEADAPVAQDKVPTSPAQPDEATARVWNLRPRKPIAKKSSNSLIIGGAVRIGGAPGQEIRSLDLSNRAEAALLRSGAAADEKREADERKLKFSIPLSKEEIEADFLAFTGSRPVRRPKKRPRTIQRALDFCFPGLWLANISADSYKVVGNFPKPENRFSSCNWKYFSDTRNDSVPMIFTKN